MYWSHLCIVSSAWPPYEYGGLHRSIWRSPLVKPNIRPPIKFIHFERGAPHGTPCTSCSSRRPAEDGRLSSRFPSRAHFPFISPETCHSRRSLYFSIALLLWLLHTPHSLAQACKRIAKTLVTFLQNTLHRFCNVFPPRFSVFPIPAIPIISLHF
jgi:hypothetical protein